MHRRLLWALALILLCYSLGWTQGPSSPPAFWTLQNDPTTGTEQYKLAKISNGTLVRAAVTDTNINLFSVLAGQGTQGAAVVVVVGEVPCVMDATNASGMSNKPVVASTTQVGQCHVQPSPPSNGIVVGTLIGDSTVSGQTSLILAQNQSYVPGNITGSGGVSSIAMTVPTEFTITPAGAITTSGTFALGKASVAANCVLSGPASGGNAQWTCRALQAADIAAALAASTARGDLNGSYPNPSVAKISGALLLPSTFSPSAFGATVNDYGPAGFATAHTIRMSASADLVQVTGLLAQPSGDTKKLCNIGTTFPLTLPNQSTSSAANNRFLMAGNLRLIPNTCKTVWYDGGSSAWRLLDSSVAEPDKVKLIGVIVGDPDTNSPVLAAGNDTPGGFKNRYGRDVTVETMTCQTAGGSVVIRPILQGGTDTSILTGDCTCTTSETACTVQTTRPVVHSYSGTGITCTTTPCGIDFNIVSVDGVAKYLNISGHAMLQ